MLSVLLAGCGGAQGSGTDSDGTGGPGGTEGPGNPTTTVSVCVEHCNIDLDCFRDGVDAGYQCIDEACMLVSSHLCSDDQFCIIRDNGITPCTGQADCGPTDACVDLGDGVGYCLDTPTERPCADENRLEVQYPHIDDGTQVAVCIRNSECDLATQYCESRCESDAECYEGTPTSSCNLATHRCECVADEPCRTSEFAPTALCIDGRCGCGTDADCHGDTSRCLPDGTCGCASDEDCPRIDSNTDICVDGVCGCSSTAACTARLENTQVACEAP